MTLAPEGSRSGRRDLHQNTVSGSDGAFSFESIAPGAYRVFAWEQIPETEDQNEEFRLPYVGQSSFITVEQDGSVETEVRLMAPIP